jgi:hypothetical protein
MIDYKSIVAFNPSSKQNNDKNNKLRENIIGSIINDMVPPDFYVVRKWLILKHSILRYIEKLTNKPYNSMKCIHRAGRKYNYDYDISLLYTDGTEEMFAVELKYNASFIEETPQFVSPMKPSQYMSHSYEEYYYDNYLPILSQLANLPLPPRDIYLHQIHSNCPPCMEKYQELYYNGCKESSKFSGNTEHIEFYNRSKSISNESIKSFIENTDLNIEFLTQYLCKTQKNKVYMLYKNGEFMLQQASLDDYIILSVVKTPNKYRYECTCKSGKHMIVLLRWKNGNGIAFPAFQISSQ